MSIAEMARKRNWKPFAYKSKNILLKKNSKKEIKQTRVNKN